MEKLEINNSQLIRDLASTYRKLRDGEIGLKEAKQRAHNGSVLLKAANSQVDYNKYAKAEMKVEFFEGE